MTAQPGTTLPEAIVAGRWCLFVEQEDLNHAGSGRKSRVLGAAAALGERGWNVEIAFPIRKRQNSSLPSQLRPLRLPPVRGARRAVPFLMAWPAARWAVKRRGIVVFEDASLQWAASLLRFLRIPFLFEAQVIESTFYNSPGMKGNKRRRVARRQEAWFMRHAKHVIVLSEDDRQQAIQMFGLSGSKITTIAHSLTEPWFSPLPQTKGKTTTKVLFLGSWHHLANQESIHFIVEELAPLLHEAMPDVRLVIAGSGVPDLKHDRGNVIIVPDAPDAVAIMDDADICLAPVFSGSGVRTKVLEYMARGKPVVANRTALEGIAAPPGHAYVLAESAEDFVRHIMALAKNPAMQRSLGQAGRRYVEAKHSWDANGELLARLLENQA